MGLFDGLVTGGRLMASTPEPTADFWYQPTGTMTAAGMRISPEGAQKLSAWYRGRDILATSLAMLPLKVYKRLPNAAGSEAAPYQPLYDIVHRKPNAWQDAFQYWRAAAYNVIDDGWHYAEIVAGQRGFVDQLKPIDPKLVTPELKGAGWLFHIRDAKTGRTDTKTQDEIFYLRGADGKGILEYARDSIGLGITLETYASKLFSNGTMNSGIIETPGPMPDDDAKRALAKQFHTGRGNWHMPKILPNGAKFNQTTMEPEKAQMILSRQFSVTDIARWLGLPEHMLNGTTNAQGVTGLEQRGQEFVTFSLGPWLSLVEAAINDQLILNTDSYFAEFTRDALARGSLLDRWTAYVSSVNAGIVMPDEVRSKENLPKVGGKASELREPQNITGRGATGGPQDKARPGRQGAPDNEARLAQAEAIATSSAARLLRKEIAAVQQFAVKHAANGDAFAVAVTNFYAKHAELVEQTLLLSQAEAEKYCASQASQVIDGHWVDALELWRSEDFAAGLAALALMEVA